MVARPASRAARAATRVVGNSLTEQPALAGDVHMLGRGVVMAGAHDVPLAQQRRERG